MSGILSQSVPLHTNIDGKTYIITHDLPNQVQLFKGLGLATPAVDHPIFAQIKEGLVRVFKNIFPDKEIKSIDVNELSQEIWSLAAKKIGNQRAITISTCFELAATRRGHTLEVNRIVDSAGNIIGIGPRPGYPSLRDQLDGIAALVDETPLIIMEDGSFTGETLQVILEKMQKRNIRVSTIVIGFCFPKAATKIRQFFDGEIIIVEQTNNLIDWVPDHDFFPFVPNCGRVFGAPFGDECLPFYSFEGASYSFPYITPFGDPGAWASIPNNRFYDLSHFCICRMTDLFKLMNELNNKSLLIGDIAFTRPRVSIPLRLKEKRLLRLDTDIVAFLEELRSNHQY